MDKKTNKSRTSTLFKLLFKASNLEQFIKKYEEEINLPLFSEYITKLCRHSGQVPEQIIKRANIERSFGHQLFKGTRNPSRDTVLQLAFGFKADTDMAQELLKYARMSLLYPRVKRDAVILYCLNNCLTVVETQNVLHEMGLPLIGGNKSK